MASGSSGRANNSGSKGFDFASDDILCSYEDYGNQQGNNGAHSDPSIESLSAKEYQKSRAARSSVFPTTNYSPPEESSFNQDVISTVEKSMKKHTDNLLRFLEGISSRLSQLELYCYNLDKSIGEMRSDLVRDHEDSESKLKILEKHVQEIHRSVQILRDKQELADTQKELAKLQLAQKESASAGNNQQNEERPTQTSSEPKKSENSSDMQGQQLALALPHQVAAQPTLPARPVEPQQPPMAPQTTLPPQSMPQVQAYYLPPQQIANVTAPPHPSQSQYMPTQAQINDISRMAPQQPQSQVNQSPQVQPLPPYQQQWQLQPQVQPPQQTVMQTQIRSSTQTVYPSYLHGQPNQPPSEMAPSSIPMQVSYMGAPQPVSGGPETMPYGYNTPIRPVQPQPSALHLKPGYGVQSGDGYVSSGPRPALPPASGYMMFEVEGGRTHHPPPQPHFQQSPYPPSNIALQNQQRMPNANMGAPQSIRNHPFYELIEKLMNMGYRAEHVIGVIERLEDSGQPIDFNAVLDMLNGHSSGGPQRGWSA